MKKTLLSALALMASSIGFAQSYDTVSVHDLQFVDATNLANCNDSSSYFGDTVVVYGKLIHSGALTEIASGSAPGGYRPEVYIVDTANNGQMAPFSSLAVHGYDGTNHISSLTSLVEGTVVRITGHMGAYQGMNQLYPLSNADVVATTISSASAAVSATVADFNDDQQVNQLETGEQWEGAFVELTNVTVSSVNTFNGNRVSLTVVDAAGNKMNVGDRFLAQRLPSYTTVNPQSPATAGSFVIPPVGAIYSSLKGIITHSGNGCLGGGRGYEINPFDSSHYQFGPTPPIFSNIVRNPVLVKSSDSPKVSAQVEDADGNVVSVKLFYAVGESSTSFTSVNMALKSGSTNEYEATIPAQTDGEIVKYYLEAIDNDNKVSTFPFTPNGAANMSFTFYTVRDGDLEIVDIQRTFDNNEGKSTLDGETVTVTGIVTAAAIGKDLGTVYIQQEGKTKWAGIALVQNGDLTQLKRGHEVKVTGVVAEMDSRADVTTIQVSSLQKTGNVGSIEPVVLNPSDSVVYAEDGARPYEAMLVDFVNPQANSTIKIVSPDANYGYFTVGVDTMQSFNNSFNILTGQQYASNWVSLVTLRPNLDFSAMQIDSVQTEKGMMMDTLRGIMVQTFGRFRLLPRNNSDVIGLKKADGTPVSLTETLAEVASSGNVSVQAVTENVNVLAFPNPAEDVFNVKVESNETVVATVYDLTGRTVLTKEFNQTTTLNTANFGKGMFIMNLADQNGSRLAVVRFTVK